MGTQTTFVTIVFILLIVLPQAARGSTTDNGIPEGGRLNAYFNFSASAASGTAITSRRWTTTPRIFDAVEMTRMEMVWRHSIAGPLRIGISAGTPDEFGGAIVPNDLNLLELWLDAVFRPALVLRVGRMRAPFGSESWQEAQDLAFSERTQLFSDTNPRRAGPVELAGTVRDSNGGLIRYSYRIHPSDLTVSRLSHGGRVELHAPHSIIQIGGSWWDLSNAKGRETAYTSDIGIQIRPLHATFEILRRPPLFVDGYTATLVFALDRPRHVPEIAYRFEHQNITTSHTWRASQAFPAGCKVYIEYLHTGDNPPTGVRTDAGWRIRIGFDWRFGWRWE